MNSLSPTAEPPADGPEDAQLTGYRTVCLSAVVGLLFGLMSGVVLLKIPLLWLFPAVAVFINLRALRAIAAPGTMLTGRWMAYQGLFLSVLFCVTGPVDAVAGRWFLERSAQPVAAAWWAALRSGEPEKALELTHTAGLRRPLDAQLALYYRTSKKGHDELKAYVAQPLVKTLLLLGEHAKVRHFDTASIESDSQHDLLVEVYVVSFDDGGKKTSFFVDLTLERADDFSQQSRWRVLTATGGVRPQGWLE
jgi:hypothetical protein